MMGLPDGFHEALPGDRMIDDSGRDENYYFWARDVEDDRLAPIIEADLARASELAEFGAWLAAGGE